MTIWHELFLICFIVVCGAIAVAMKALEDKKYFEDEKNLIQPIT
jgi:hypothetical protein